ncbi:hypothetical protein CSKR_202859 [Clonorchis sinensis]|uniref:Uncharacterized protein n=1 Tax=Clonorchis sinensis TaxID=79923 RepID=A0A8T1M2X9_CLOSI|nr:hypothetical protein CSKR_202859 [Clonorchis sinensis]
MLDVGDQPSQQNRHSTPYKMLVTGTRCVEIITVITTSVYNCRQDLVKHPVESDADWFTFTVNQGRSVDVQRELSVY